MKRLLLILLGLSFVSCAGAEREQLAPPLPTLTVTALATPTLKPTNIATDVPTATATALPTDIPTELPTTIAPTETPTRLPSLTPMPTNTPLPPTATPLPPTATNVPPTATNIPPTATVVRPTATPQPVKTVAPTAQPTAQGATIPPSLQPLMEKIIADMTQRTGATGRDLFVNRVDQVTWNDSALGCPQPGMMYMQVITEGYQIVLQYSGRDYYYHTNGERSFVYCEKPIITKDLDSQ